MRPDDWHLTEDLDDFLARTRDFLHSRPVLHTLPLTVTETLRTRGAHAYGAEAPVFGRLERAGEVHAAFFRTPPRRLNLTPLAPEHADTLAARLAGLGHLLPGVGADHETATAFAEAWQRHTGATPTLVERKRLYRLGTLTPPEPLPAGRGRIAGEQDREQLELWHREFAAAVGEAPSVDAGSWADTRIAHGRVTLWETPDGTPVSMAGVTPMVAGQIRVTPVYTPAHRRGRGYAGAATAEVSRAALAAGATEVVLFTDVANPTSNGLYRRIGYLPVAGFAVYDFGTMPGSPTAPAQR
ncbi:GNAT family N-acetyltransferase [Streptomyces sp. TRM S81-3]|uniref:GNAT family N-acetyltransferase n=1 Tax=Streptomyces griseicoloratus TaxID=2752516 RepID=A0A926QS51_9ACTN|nr:GNAT family N-acetyltransferase [Streptomyces griseicoloratus]MBD0421646.1 GNAT family N-acetyltransferase [Streptomyces griseicoloratus]